MHKWELRTAATKCLGKIINRLKMQTSDLPQRTLVIPPDIGSVSVLRRYVLVIEFQHFHQAITELWYKWIMKSE